MQPYRGFTRDLSQRLRAHREGDGGVTTRRVFDQGIGFTLARVRWPGVILVNNNSSSARLARRGL